MIADRIKRLYNYRGKSLWHRPRVMAVVIFLLIALWVLSGLLVPSDRQVLNTTESVNTSSSQANDLPIKIETRKAVSKAQKIILNGVTEPDRITLIEAETEGKVLKIHYDEGSQVKSGDVLIELDLRNRENILREAELLVEQRRVELNAAKRLYKDGFQSKVRYSQAQAALSSAQRQLKQARLDISYTKIRAPYDGIVEEILVEEGDLIGKGFSKQTVMRFVDLSPLKIRGQISEKDRILVKKNDTALIRLSNGKQFMGKIAYLSSVADEETRSFRTEVLMSNEGNVIHAGVSAEITLEVDKQPAYQVSSSLLSLDDSGQIGVKLVDDSNIIRFTPVEILSQSENGIWVGGLPDHVRLVTDGAAFVADGQKLLIKSATKLSQGTRG